VKWLARALLGSLLLALTGCVPFPHRYQYRPRFEGQLTDAGAPAAGVRVLVTAAAGDTACASPEAGAITKPDGTFTLAGERRLALLLPLMGDRAESWSVCLIPPDGAPIAWAWHRLTPGREPVAVMSLRCDLAWPPEHRCTLAERE
jgi:hypothetical protein